MFLLRRKSAIISCPASMSMLGCDSILISSPRLGLSHPSTSSRLFHGFKRGALRRRTDHKPYSTKPPPHADNPAGKKPPLFRRLANAWNNTETKWYPLPVAVGGLLLVLIQYRKRQPREVHVDEEGREVVRLKGPWHVHVLGALPLRNMSRLWGYVNSLELPVWLRPVGIRVYAWTFGCNLDEMEPASLIEYPSLGAFFYRKLKDGVRPIADTVLVSPADGKVLHFGTVQGSRVEQVKGSTYSLDALLGVPTSSGPAATTVEFPERHLAEVDDRTFADINGIEYSLQDFIGASTPGTPTSSGTTTPVNDTPPDTPQQLDEAQSGTKKYGKQIDASVSPDGSLSEVVAHDASVAAEIGVRPSLQRKQSSSSPNVKPGNSLHFIVIYLAPGDYHRFHSPAAWVVEKRRHFVGDLFSVSPWMAKRLENLFVLNERVALLGKWKHGFFGMVPVGATNVGSIKINFDQALRTNVGPRRKPPVGTYSEAVYSAASPILNGQPLIKGQEMGGFCLGSTIVLVFEAPQDFQFSVTAGQKIKVGEAIGDVDTRRLKARP